VRTAFHSSYNGVHDEDQVRCRNEDELAPRGGSFYLQTISIQPVRCLLALANGTLFFAEQFWA
jgi:hypothetical protein